MISDFSICFIMSAAISKGGFLKSFESLIAMFAEKSPNFFSFGISREIAPAALSEGSGKAFFKAFFIIAIKSVSILIIKPGGLSDFFGFVFFVIERF